MAVAAYLRIAGDLRKKITSREIKPGGQLPSELELRVRHEASRNTVLDAIRMLKDEGLVETRPGLGWFVKIQIEPFVNTIDWADEATARAEALGRVPSATPPTVTRLPASPEIAGRLRIREGSEMIVRRQEWFLDDLPWKLQAAWCPRARYDEGADQLLIAEDIPQGLDMYLRDALSLRLADTAFYFLPRKPTLEEIKFFDFPDEGDIPYVIELVRTANSQGDDGPSPLYLTVGIYACDRNRFESSWPVPAAERPPATPSERR
jgi:GntR family transcriptional regulator